MARQSEIQHPRLVLTRARGGFKDLDITAAQQEIERQRSQVQLVALSTNGEQRIIESGADMQGEAPEDVVRAIHDVFPGHSKEPARSAQETVDHH
jgi:hypothetical protein